MAVPIDLRARVRGNGLADSCCRAGGPQLWSLSASGHAMTARSGFNRSKSFQSIQVIDVAGVVQWQNGSFPSCIRGFDSLRPLRSLAADISRITIAKQEHEAPDSKLIVKAHERDR
jgi:hypothetical protein